VLKPCSRFGPITGKGTGRFGQFFMQAPWVLLLRREALERLQSAGIRGLQGCPIHVRFRGKDAPELLELQLRLHGRIHPSIFPPHRKPPCPTCGTDSNKLPHPILLDAASLPADVDVFRMEDIPGVILATERFVEAVQRLGLDGVTFRALETR
jgi:uncharacterized double-CXXCG motif protein